MKIFAHLYFATALEILVAIILIFWGSDIFADDKSFIPEVLYYISSIALAVYLLCPTTRSNPGKKNFNLIALSFTHTIRFYQSINPPNHVRPIQNITLEHMPKSLAHRPPIPTDKKNDLRY